MSFFRHKKPTETERGETWWRDFAWEDIPHEAVVRASVPIEPLVALNCSRCGAPFNPSTRHCEYCGTWFGPKSPTPELYGKPIEGEYAPMGAFVQKDYDKTVEALSDSATKLQRAIDADAFNKLLGASEKFKSIGLLSG
jgi:hypothetical protein